jgi:hypothetical protein
MMTLGCRQVAILRARWPKFTIENVIADLAAPMLNRIAELRAIRDQARVDAGRPRMRSTGSGQASHRKLSKRGGYRRDRLRALAQRVEVDAVSAGLILDQNHRFQFASRRVPIVSI